MYPLAREVAAVIVSAARICGDDPIEIATGKLRLRGRVYAFLALCHAFPEASRTKLCSMVGGGCMIAMSIRTMLKSKRTWFSIQSLNEVLSNFGIMADSIEQCIEVTYANNDTNYVSRTQKENRQQRNLPAEQPSSMLTDEEVEALPVETINDQPFQVKQRFVELAMIRRRYLLSAEQKALAEIDHIPTKDEQIAALGQMVVIKRDDEPSFERSALAERVRASDIIARELKDEITLFVEGYNHGLHGDEQGFPLNLVGKGADYRLGWAAGFGDRGLAAPAMEIE